MPLPASRGGSLSRALPRSREACVRALPANFIDHLLRTEQTFSRPVSLFCCFQESFVVWLYYFCNSHIIQLLIFLYYYYDDDDYRDYCKNIFFLHRVGLFSSAVTAVIVLLDLIFEPPWPDRLCVLHTMMLNLCIKSQTSGHAEEKNTFSRQRRFHFSRVVLRWF